MDENQVELNIQQRTPRKEKRGVRSFVGNIRQPISARFGRAVRNRRKQQGMTQTELSTVAGLSRSYVSEVECGRESISLERAERIASALDTNLADLLKEG